MEDEKLGNLCITRKINEEVDVQTPSGMFTIKVIECKSGSTRLLFKCPESIRIIRTELKSKPRTPVRNER